MNKDKAQEQIRAAGFEYSKEVAEDLQTTMEAILARLTGSLESSLQDETESMQWLDQQSVGYWFITGVADYVNKMNLTESFNQGPGIGVLMHLLNEQVQNKYREILTRGIVEKFPASKGPDSGKSKN